MKTVKEVVKKYEDRETAKYDQETQNLLIYEKGRTLNHVADIQEPNNAWLIAEISKHLRNREKEAGDYDNVSAMDMETVFCLAAQIKSPISLHRLTQLMQGWSQSEAEKTKKHHVPRTTEPQADEIEDLFKYSCAESNHHKKIMDMRDSIIDKLFSCNDFNLLWLIDQLTNALDTENAKENSDALQRYAEADLFKKIISLSSGERECVRKLATRFLKNAGEEENV